MDDLADRLTVFADRDSPRGAGAIWHAARRSARRQRVARRSIVALTVAVLAVVAVTVAAGHRHDAVQAPASTTTTTLPLPRTTGPGSHCIAINPKHPYVTPDPGFNPLTASASELQQHHFPPKPSASDTITDSHGQTPLQAWMKYAEGYMEGKVVQCANPSPSQEPAWVKRIGHHVHAP
jgi:hypothetical protein